MRVIEIQVVLFDMLTTICICLVVVEIINEDIVLYLLNPYYM